MSRQQLCAVWVCVCVWETLWQSLWEKPSSIFPGCLYINLLSLSVILKWRRDIANYKWRCLRLRRTPTAAPQWVLLNACLVDATVGLVTAATAAAVVVVICLVCNLWATCALCLKGEQHVCVCVYVYAYYMVTKKVWRALSFNCVRGLLLFFKKH